MISYSRSHVLPDGAKYVEGACLSTDTLPTDGIANGSYMIIMDVPGSILYYDGGNKAWLDWGS